MLLRPCFMRFVIVLIVTSSFALSAHADERSSAVVLYEADPACPSRREFEAAVVARTERAQFVDPDETTARIFRLRVERATPNGFVGRLDTTDAKDAAVDRTIAGATCADVVFALALVTALAIDPAAPVRSGSTDRKLSVEPLPSSTEPLEVAPTHLTSWKEEARNQPPPTASSKRSILASAAGVAAFGISPHPALGAELRVRIEQPRRGPSIAFGASLLSSTPIDHSPRATFRFITADLEGCPIGIILSPAIDAHACAAIAMGVIDARGVDIANPELHSQPWVDARGLARFAVSDGRFGLEVRGGALAPLTRPTFVFQAPRALVHETPSIAAFAVLGASVRAHKPYREGQLSR